MEVETLNKIRNKEVWVRGRGGNIPGRGKGMSKGLRKERTQQVEENGSHPMNLDCKIKGKYSVMGRQAGAASIRALGTMPGFPKTGDFRTGGICH